MVTIALGGINIVAVSVVASKTERRGSGLDNKKESHNPRMSASRWHVKGDEKQD